MEHTPPHSLAEWVEEQGEHTPLDAAVSGGEGISWVGRPRLLSALEQEFLEWPLSDIPSLVLEQWPRARQVPALLNRLIPAFGDLFSTIEEAGCIWPAGAEATAATLVVRRSNPRTGDPLVLLFAPGVPTAEAMEFEEQAGLVLPDVLRALYGTFAFLQGGDAALHEGLIGLLPGLALGGVLAEREAWIEWCKEVGGESGIDTAAFADYLPLYANGEGDYIAWLGRGRQPEEPEVWYFSHDTLELYQGDRTISRFLSRLIRRVYLGPQEAFEFDT